VSGEQADEPDGGSGGFRRGARLGVDVGTVRVGVAACDPDGLLVTAVTTLARDPRRGADLDGLRQLVAERRVVEVVVGLPRSLSGAEGPAATAARGYAGRLAAAVAPVPVRLVDERLSTVEAAGRLRGAGHDSRASRRLVDAQAAAVILETALAAERSSGRPPGEPASAAAGVAATGAPR
jgi:putative Holliday junction resolvase